jgi:hypothetical protein
MLGNWLTGVAIFLKLDDNQPSYILDLNIN